MDKKITKYIVDRDGNGNTIIHSNLIINQKRYCKKCFRELPKEANDFCDFECRKEYRLECNRGIMEITGYLGVTEEWIHKGIIKERNR